MQELIINYPPKREFDTQSLSSLCKEICKSDVSKIFVITVNRLKPRIEYFIKTLEENHIDVEVESNIVLEPSFEDFECLLEHANQFNPDVVLGIGSGNLLDVTKLVASQLDSKLSSGSILYCGYWISKKNQFDYHLN